MRCRGSCARASPWLGNRRRGIRLTCLDRVWGLHRATPLTGLFACCFCKSAAWVPFPLIRRKRLNDRACGSFGWLLPVWPIAQPQPSPFSQPHCLPAQRSLPPAPLPHCLLHFFLTSGDRRSRGRPLLLACPPPARRLSRLRRSRGAGSRQRARPAAGAAAARCKGKGGERGKSGKAD
jgi:hypothetical protein